MGLAEITRLLRNDVHFSEHPEMETKKLREEPKKEPWALNGMPNHEVAFSKANQKIYAQIVVVKNSVHVQGISHQTTEKEVRDFFSFCGKITSLSVTPSDAAEAPKSATVTFEKETAAETALLLDNTRLGPSQVHVSTASSLNDIALKPPASEKASGHAEDISQEDKPRSRILARYLAQGYTIFEEGKLVTYKNSHPADRGNLSGFPTEEQNGELDVYESYIRKKLWQLSTLELVGKQSKLFTGKTYQASALDASLKFATTGLVALVLATPAGASQALGFSPIYRVL